MNARRPTLALASLLLAVPVASATQAIANWDVVPSQRLAEPFKAGVVAFHETGVDVAFQVNGQDAGRVTDPTWNDRTGVSEYWIEIDPADYPDGPITLSATAIPDGPGHESRQLADLILHANSGGTLGASEPVWVDAANGSDTTGTGTETAPFATIAKGVQAAPDGGTVYLKASRDYKLTGIGGGSGTQYWTTISAAPGLTPDDVHILTYGRDASSTGRYGRTNIRWANVSLYCDRDPGYGSVFYFSGDRTWFDGVVLFDANGRHANTHLFNSQRGATTYLTDSHIRDVTNSGGGFQRNVRIENIGADVYRSSSGLTAINVRIHNMDKGDTGAHPDFFQLHIPNGTAENLIFYNIHVTDMLAQGIFGGDGILEDAAFVNILLEKDPPSSNLRSQLSGHWRHVLFWNFTVVDQTFDFRNSGNLRDIDVRNGVFALLTIDNYGNEEVEVRSCHTGSLQWNQTTPMGSNPTMGDPLFASEGADDYRLSPDSPAWGTGIPCPGVPADIGGYPYDPETPNRGAFSAENPGPGHPPRRPSLDSVSLDFDEDAGITRIEATLRAAPAARHEIRSGGNLRDWGVRQPLFADANGRVSVRENVEGPVSRRFFELSAAGHPFLAIGRPADYRP